MTHFLEVSFAGFNVVYTVLVLLVMFYWLVVILGAIDIDLFDFDLGGGDGDIGGDGAEVGSEGLAGWLAFFNVNEAPVMFFATVVALVMWIVSVQTYQVLEATAPEWLQQYYGWLALLLAVPNLLFGMFVAKYVVLPFRFFRQVKVQHVPLEGRVGVVTSEKVDDTFGRVEIPYEGGTLLVNVCAESDSGFSKGDAVEIVEPRGSSHGEVYLVKAID